VAETRLAAAPDEPSLEPKVVGCAFGVYSSPRGEPRFRRATDVVLLVPSALGLAILVALYPPGPFERALAGWLASIPGFTSPVWWFMYDLLPLWAILLVATAVVARRWFVLVQGVAAFALAAGLALVCARLAVGGWPDVVDAVRGGATGPRFPATRFAEAAAVALTMGPHLVLPLQRLGRWLLALSLVGALVVDNAVPTGNLAGLMIAFVVASAVRLVLGTSAGRPGLEQVASALGELGLTARDLHVAERQDAGVFALRARDAEGRSLLVKVHGRDAYDNQLLEKLWRTLWYQDGGPSLRLGPAQVAEHEAFVTLLAASRGVPMLEVLRAASTSGGNAALLVVRGEARPLASLAADELDRGVLRSSWTTLELLHSAGIAHRRIDTQTIVVIEDRIGLADLGGATAAPTLVHLLTDRAQLLVATATLAGPVRALEAAASSLGHEGLAALLPYLQPAALHGQLRRETKAAGLDIDHLRKGAATALGAEDPQLVRLVRVTWRAFLQSALLLAAALVVLSFATGIDYQQLWSGLENASWGWLLLAFLVAQAPRVTQAVATLGSVSADLRFGPVYLMQLATGYMNLALPSSTARLAVNIRFFQRQGITSAAAITAGAIDSFASTVVQAILLAVLLLFTEANLHLELSTPSGGSLAIVAVLAVLLVAAVAVVALVGLFRRFVVGWIRRAWPEVRTALSGLRSSNKLVLLLGGSLATEILFGLALGLFALGLGTRIGLADVLVLNIGVTLINTIVPIPGGIGVSELGLTVGLASAGMSEEAALAAALLYRISSFYVPPVWGFFALRFLQRSRYL
jgi:uncharacterized protein (TIRG00374 family)